MWGIYRTFWYLFQNRSEGEGAPMTEAQKEYIITEEQLQELIRWYPIDTWGYEKGSSFRSRPYKSDDAVLDRLCKICPYLDERPDTCENCVVETVRKELQRAEREQG